MGGINFLAGPSANQDQDTPTAPQQPANNAANAGPVKAGLRGVLGGLLRNFSYGAGQSMLKAAGEETDAERATRLAATAHINAQTQAIQQQMTMVPVQLGNGTVIHLPPKMATDLLKQQLANQGKTDTAKIQKRFLTTPQGLYDTQTQDPNTGYPSLIPNTAAGVPITPEIAEDYGLPKDYIGKYAKISDLSSAQRGNASQMALTQGAKGPALVNKVQGTAKDLGLGSPAVGASAARAANTPFQTYDSDGNLITTSAAKAIATGAPSASVEFAQQGPTSSTRTAGQTAGAVSSHIPNLRDEANQLEKQGKLGPVMGRINAYMNSGYGGDDPLVAQFVSDMQLMNSGKLRAHFGARGASNIYDKFTQSLNTAQTAAAINGSLDSAEKWLKTYGDIGKFQAPHTGITRPGASSGPKLATPPSVGASLTDSSIAKKYLDAAGGNKAAARKMAQADGWKF